jgi:hypothetical protein
VLSRFRFKTCLTERLIFISLNQWLTRTCHYMWISRLSVSKIVSAVADGQVFYSKILGYHTDVAGDCMFDDICGLHGVTSQKI